MAEDIEKSPLVTVLMPVYNASPYLKQAIESILEQTYDNYEFLIIDDGSTDASLSIIRQYATANSKLRVVSRSNRGLVNTLNEGVLLARGKYIARQDADDMSLPLRLEKQVLFMERHTDALLVGSNYEFIDSQGAVSGATDVFTKHNDIKPALIFSNQFGHGTVMVDKNGLINSGLYDANYAHAEDYELWSRIADRGSVYNLSDILYQWRMHSQNITTMKAEEMHTQVKKIQKRQSEVLLHGLVAYSLWRFYPFSTRRGMLRYASKKSALLRNISLLTFIEGRKKTSVALSLLAIFFCPWSPRGYRMLFARSSLNLPVAYEDVQ